MPSTVCFKSSTAYIDFDKANLFNKFFHSVFHNPSVVPNVDELPDIPGSPQVIGITASVVYEVLVSLDIDKSSGKMKSHPEFYKIVQCSTSLFIYYVFKIYFDTFQVEDSQDYSSI